MKNLITGMLLSFLLSLAPAYSQETLSIVGDFKAKPKNWLDNAGNTKGIMIDIFISGKPSDRY